MTELRPKTKSMAVLCGTALVWCGLLLGVSFLATPAKFLAPSLSLSVALDVGRQTFVVFNRTEWLLGALLAIIWFFSGRARWSALLITTVVAIVLTETLWLLPMLDARVAVVMAGGMLEPAGYHNFYIGLEGLKAFALLGLGVHAFRALAANRV